MKKCTTLILAGLITIHLVGQQTGLVNYKHLGISFNIPEGWVGQETDGGYLMGSNNVPGLIMMIPHEIQSVKQLEAEARRGLNEGNGTALSLQGDIEQLGNNAIGGEYSGTLEWQAAKGYAVGTINPHGTGVTIIAITTADKYSADYKNYAMQVKNSLVYKKPETGPIVNQWKRHLSNVKLIYMDSYYSSSYTDGGVSGGYSSEIQIDLCAQGYFNYQGNNEVSAGSNYSSLYSGDNNKGHGNWNVVVGAGGQPILRLNFNNGEVYEYNLELREEKTYLNGNKYFRTTTGEYAPNCY
ncbi:MAG: hypothetical protein GVY19_07655 [Bacteroidetes bacterium]|jgi:hypothetical protein|nr:hypothetical protein [Bacteroidota bacterium]